MIFARAAVALYVVVACSECAAPLAQVEGPLVELRLDEGRASERPLTPGRPFELLMRFDPGVPAFSLHRLRFRLAMPGRMTIAIYPVGADGHPGPLAWERVRRYPPELASPAAQGRWVIEEVGLPLGGPFFIGLSAPDRQGDPRLWASTGDSGEVYQRDVDPPGSISHIKRTPFLRVEIEPTDRR